MNRNRELNDFASAAALRTLPRRNLAKTSLATDQSVIAEVFLVLLILLSNTERSTAFSMYAFTF